MAFASLITISVLMKKLKFGNCSTSTNSKRCITKLLLLLFLEANTRELKLRIHSQIFCRWNCEGVTGSISSIACEWYLKKQSIVTVQLFLSLIPNKVGRCG